MQPKVSPTKSRRLRATTKTSRWRTHRSISLGRKKRFCIAATGELMREVFRILKPGASSFSPTRWRRAGGSSPTDARPGQPRVLRDGRRIPRGREGSELRGSRLRRSDGRFLTNYRTIVAKRARHDELKQEISEAFIEKIGNGMQYWVDGGEASTWSGAVSTL